jgi:putative resolvase
LQYRGLISSKEGLVIAYARVSSPSQKKDLALQKEALRAYCLEHRIKVDQWIEDTGSALNYKRKGFNQVIEQIEVGQVARLIIGYEDRFVRFGYDWFEQFCERHGTQITVVNGKTFSPEEELVRDLIAIVTVFSARLHGLRSHKNLIRAAALGKEIKDDQDTQDQTPSHA